MHSIVIGAGILGASTAYHLAKAGHRVTIAERDDVGQATSAAAGIVCPWLTQRRNKPWYELVKAGAKYYPLLIEELTECGEIETGYAKVGAISLHHEESKLLDMEKRALKRREDAPEIGTITRLSEEDTHRFFPVLAQGYQALHVSGGARVDGRALRNSLIRAAQKFGAVFLQGEASFIKQKDAVIGVRVNGNDIFGEQIIVTSGCWAAELLKKLPAAFNVKPQKAQILHLELQGVDTSNWPVVMPPGNQYLVAFDGGRIVLGATHEDDALFDTRVTAGGVHELLSKGLAVAPGLADASIVDTRVGFRPFTPGFLPVVGALPSYENVWVANGLGASGLTAGPFLGKEVANIVQGKKTILDFNQFDITSALG